MKPEKIKGATKKIANIMIVGLVLLGTVAFMFVGQVNGGAEGMSKLFLLFFGAIITIQIVPGLMLLGAMLKGIFSLARKEEATATADKTESK